RCPYCDFATAPATTALRGRYLGALGCEIAHEGELLGRPRVRTLFFGGGTPSLLEPMEIAALGDALRSSFTLRPREVTIEANPATLDRDRAAAAALEPDHISCYPLELRLDPDASVPNWPGGGWPVLERWRQAAAAAQPDDAGLARMYRTAERALGRAGYRHYEIANWARPGK